jgi:hypothetical protein
MNTKRTPFTIWSWWWASCLLRRIFGEALQEHPDPNAKIIGEARARGRLRKNLSRATILEDDPAADTL